MIRTVLLSSSVLFAAALALGACDRKDDKALENLDKSLTGNQADPALTAALEDQIVIDPKTGQPKPGTLLRAPKPTPAPADLRDGRSLGELAKKQAGPACNEKLEHNNSWAARLPTDIPLYPGARVTEAAGKCDFRVVTFTTSAPLQTVIDFYYTKAVRAGFSAEHLTEGGDSLLGGTRAKDDSAYYVVARPVKTGTEVDLIANKGG